MIIHAHKGFCADCGREVGGTDIQCVETCSNYPKFLNVVYKSFTKVKYDSVLMFFNVKEELVQLPTTEFTCMKDKTDWFVNARAELRLKHLNDPIPSDTSLSRKSKIKTFLSNTLIFILEVMTRRNT